ncbi:MAG: glycosyltransferase, partial [Chitinophagaceae bacterium]|nr:glycosyltransferase [Chitinophagaceae bacterium]
MEKLVVIPTYNEKENISNILHAIFNLREGFHVLVIDDASPDGTAGIVRELQQKFPGQLFLEERRGKLGLGTAYILGFRWAIANDYEFVFEMDADFSHNPADLVRLYQACKYEGADLAIGSRYVKGGGVVNWPSNRIALSKGAS